MKNTWIASILCFIYACAPTPRQVIIDYDQDARFSEYKTFYWSDELLSESANQPLFYNSLVKKRIKEAVRSELEGRGYRLDENNPDLYVNAHMIVEEKTEYHSPTHSPYRYYYPDNVRIHNYKEGALVIDLIDRQMRQLVWQGYYTGQFVEAKTPEEKSRVIRDAVSLIFQKYQYRARTNEN